MFGNFVYSKEVSEAVDSYFKQLAIEEELNEQRLLEKTRKLEEKKAALSAEKLNLRELKLAKLKLYKEERKRLKDERIKTKEENLKTREANKVLRKEQVQRMAFLHNCKQMLEIAKRNAKTSPDEFKKALQELKRITEEFLGKE